MMFEIFVVQWVPEITHHCQRTPFLLVGTQIDLRDDASTVEKLAKNKQRPITQEAGERLVRELHAVKYVECSALTQVCVCTCVQSERERRREREREREREEERVREREVDTSNLIEIGGYVCTNFVTAAAQFAVNDRHLHLLPEIHTVFPASCIYLLEDRIMTDKDF